MEVVEHFKYLGSLKSADGNSSKDTVPNWNGLENNGRSSTELERQSNEQRPKNEISSLAGVDSSH